MAVADYEESVLERLRQTELERAQAEVQVLEEQKRLAVEQQKRKAEGQRNRLRLSLAVALLVLVSGGALGVVWYLQNQAARIARAEYLESAIEAALSQANSERIDLYQELNDRRRLPKYLSDMTLWRNKLDAAVGAHSRAKELAASDKESLLPASLEKEKQLTAQQLQDDERYWTAALRLDRIRMEAYAASNEHGKISHAVADSQYQSTFQELLGADVNTDEIQAVAERIDATPCRLVLIAALDHWATFR